MALIKAVDLISLINFSRKILKNDKKNILLVIMYKAEMKRTIFLLHDKLFEKRLYCIKIFVNQLNKASWQQKRILKTNLPEKTIF